MKTTFFLCSVALLIVVAVSDYDIDKSFFDKVGLSRMCSENQTFSEYGPCGKRCDQPEPPTVCPAVVYVGCGCKDGYIPTDKTFHKCILPQDCP
ncbi:hypothetical protein AVEN_193770-1 [Araneus ventricosus]|uniref:TIL domain-containing protein n=1 Tax=Araneus ventricosus TaxID=182803 RepID=A0A4Y2DMS9_ARAVE|nr:hypothetical protein AVEN_193770-1 [Araneus ventricosus]